MIDRTFCRRFCMTLPASRLFLAGLLTVALAIVSIVPAQAQQDQASQPGQQSEPSTPVRPIHIVPFITHPPGQNAPQTGVHLSYYGGPVISNIQIVVVYWGANVNSEIIAKIPGFYQAVTNSSYFDLLSEYSTDITPVGGGTGTNQSIGRGSFVQATTITPALGDCPPTCNLTDAQIQAELIGQINGGHLPGPQYDSAGNDNTEYAIYFPSGANITLNGATSCQAGGFCAYHGTANYNSKDLGYGIFPDVYVGGCSSGCGTASSAFQNLTSVSSHELAETVTDIAVGNAGGFAPPLAWYDTNNGEIGDICNAQQASITTPAGAYTVQKEWSNALAACVATGLHPSYQLSLPATVASGAPFNFTLTAQNPAGGKGTDTAYVGTVYFTSSDTDPGVVLPSDFTFTSSNHGTASFSATLKTAGMQSITATDLANGAITGTASTTVNNQVQVTVETSPAGLAFSVDGTTYTTPQTQTWTIGSSHTIATTTPQTPNAGVQNTFTSWSDGGALSHSVTASGSATAYTALFSTQYLLTTAANPSNGGTVTPASGTYYAAGATVNLTATANTGYAFSSWTGSVANSNSASTTVTMSAPETVTANFTPSGPTTTSLVSSANPSTFGQSVTFTATVTPTGGGTPTGTVTFTDGANVLGMISLSSGQAALSASSLGVGNHSISASYGGDSADQPSKSAPLTQTVKVASTTTGLTSSLNPAAVGQTISYTATVNGQYLGTVSGSVIFKSGATVLGSATLVNGQAGIDTSFATAGTRYISATYVGDVNNTGSKSLALQQLVNKAPSSAAVVSDVNPSDYGQRVTLTATVTCNTTPTRTVIFKYGSIVLGKVLLTGNTATLSTTALGAGTDAITGVYSGDANCASSTSPVLEQVVNIATTTESLASSPNPSAVGQAVTFTATVSSSAGVPTGKVQFMRGTALLGTVTLSGGVATFTTSKLPAGSDPITANYLGTANYGTSSASLTQVVQ
jgi:hypothetical protein